MQTVWNRVTQARCTCKCANCVTRSSAIARRASAATSRALIKPSPSATFLYSTIFAAAVVADGRAKRKRRDQWDIAIAEAKEGLHSPETLKELGQARHDEEVVGHDNGFFGLQAFKTLSEAFAPLQLPIWSTVGAFEALNMPLSHDIDKELDLGQYPNEPLLDWGFRQLDPSGNEELFPNMPLHTAEAIPQYNLPPQSLYSAKGARLKAEARAWTPKKLRLAEVKIGRLVLSMLKEAQLYDQRGAILSETKGTLRNLIQRPEYDITTMLQKHLGDYDHRLWDAPADLEGFKDPLPWLCPNYEQNGSNEYQVAVAELNNAIFDLFKSYEIGVRNRRRERNHMNQQMLILHLCDKLLNTRAAPDLRTYNILLTGFTRLGKHNYTDHIVKTILKTYTRPNEITCAAIIHHYTRKRDLEGFSHFAAKMRGLYGGLMLARPDIKITEAGAKRLVPQKNGKVVQKVHPSPIVFNALMKGVLQFAGFERTVEIYTNMHQDGWGLDTVGLRTLLIQCILRKDWDNGETIWRQMEVLRSRSKRMLERADYCAMLALCHACHQKNWYQRVFQGALQFGHQASKLSRESTLLWMSISRDKRIDEKALQAVALNDEATRKVPWEEIWAQSMPDRDEVETSKGQDPTRTRRNEPASGIDMPLQAMHA